MKKKFNLEKFANKLNNLQNTHVSNALSFVNETDPKKRKAILKKEEEAKNEFMNLMKKFIP